MSRLWANFIIYWSELVVIAALLLILTNRDFMTADNAAWAQAVFSVAAIFAAIWISGEQRRVEEARDAARDRNAILSAVALITRVESIVKALASGDGVLSDASYHSMEVIAVRLENLDLVETPSPAFLAISLEAAHTVRRYIDYRKQGKQGDRIGASEHLCRQWNKLLDSYGLTKEDLDKLIGKR